MSVNRSGVPPEAAEAVASVGRRVRNPQGQGSRLRAELVAAADDILARTGDIEGLSLRAVARAVGVATPSIYLHFPDKRALVHAVLAVRFGQLGAAVRAAVMQQPDAAGRLQAGCLAYCRFATEHPHAYRVLFGRVPATPPPPDSPLTPRPPGVALTPWPPRPLAGEGEDITLAELSTEAQESEEHVTVPPTASLPLSRLRERGLGGEGTPVVGADAFGFLVDGVQRCISAGLAPPADPARVALSVWTALHGLVSLRSSIPRFPWPPLAQQVDDVLIGLVGLRHIPAPEQE